MIQGKKEYIMENKDGGAIPRKVRRSDWAPTKIILKYAED
jgi:hypothetical protein